MSLLLLFKSQPTTGTVEESFTADAILRRTESVTFTSNAVIKRVDETSTFTANSVLRRTENASFTANAILRRTENITFTANTVLQATTSGSLTANAVLLRTEFAAFSADAVLLVITTETGTFTADSVIRETIEQTLTADAFLDLIGIPVWTTPGNSVYVGDLTPTLSFTMPTSSAPMYFEIQMDTVDTFDSPDLRTFSTTDAFAGWEYHNGTAWTPMTAAVDPVHSGRDARYTLQTPLVAGTWYRRVRGLIDA